MDYQKEWREAKEGLDLMRMDEIFNDLFKTVTGEADQARSGKQIAEMLNERDKGGRKL